MTFFFLINTDEHVSENLTLVWRRNLLSIRNLACRARIGPALRYENIHVCCRPEDRSGAWRRLPAVGAAHKRVMTRAQPVSGLGPPLRYQSLDPPEPVARYLVPRKGEPAPPCPGSSFCLRATPKKNAAAVRRCRVPPLRIQPMQPTAGWRRILRAHDRVRARTHLPARARDQGPQDGPG